MRLGREGTVGVPLVTVAGREPPVRVRRTRPGIALRLVAGGLAVTAPPAVAARPAQVREAVVEIGDDFVRTLCTGGPVRVVLVHGERSGADAYGAVLERLDGRVGACAYDRSPGDAPDPAPRGWFELAERMRLTHAALGAEPAYLLVGHGIGGLYARLLAAGRPGDVGALLLLEPAHEDLPEALRPGMPSAAWDALMRSRLEPNEDGLREIDLAERARRSRLPNIPVTVVTATRRRSGDGWDERYLNQGARRVHAQVLQGITSGRHLPAQGIGHDIHVEAPDLVAAEALRLTRDARSAPAGRGRP